MWESNVGESFLLIADEAGYVYGVMMDRKIRKAAANDLSKIEQIARTAYQKYVSRIGKEPAPMLADFSAHLNDDTIFVVEDGRAQDIIAYAVIVVKEGQFWLENIAVAPANSAQGVGTDLIHFVEGFIADFADEYFLYTNIKMIENIDWYQRIGFTEIKRMTEDGFERVYFCKKLDANNLN